MGINFDIRNWASFLDEIVGNCEMAEERHFVTMKMGINFSVRSEFNYNNIL